MNDALKRWIEEGNKITEVSFGMQRDLNICMNCKGVFSSDDLTKGSQRRCKKCFERHTSLKES